MKNLKKIAGVIATAMLAEMLFASVVSAGPKFNSSTASFLLSRKLSAEEFSQEIEQMVSQDEMSDIANTAKITIGNTTMEINGRVQAINIDENGRNDGTTAIIEQDRTMLPARAIAETFGYEVGWNEKEKKVTISSDEENKKIELVVDQNEIKVNSQKHDLEVAPIVKNKRTLIPLRSVSEVMGCDVQWNEESKTAVISKLNTNGFETKRIVAKINNMDRLSNFQPEGCTNAIVDEYGIAVYQFDSEDNARNGFEELQKTGCCEFVEEDKYSEITMSDVDSSAGTHSWGTMQTGLYNYAAYIKTLNPTDAVNVAIIDTGLYKAHPVFSGRLQQRTIKPDYNGHGTHVAGIIAEATQSVADNVKIYSYKNFNSSGLYITTIELYSTINEAVDNGADIINMSFGGEGFNTRAIRDKIDYAIAQGVIVVAAAGNRRGMENINGAADMIYPAAYTDVCTVSAVGNDNQPADFAYNGNVVDISAPGVDIISAKIEGDYTAKSGTSQATPHVAAALALMKLDPNFRGKTGSILIQALKDNAKRPNNWNSNYGTGVLCMDNFAPKITPDIVGIEGTEISLAVGEQRTAALTAVMSDSTRTALADLSKCTFSSDNPAVAEIAANGSVTGKTAGNTHISIQYNDGEKSFSAQFAVTVTATAQQQAVSYEWSVGTQLTLKKGEERNVRYFSVQNGEKTDITGEYTYESTNSQVAEVSSDGTLKANGEGTAYITPKNRVADTIQASSNRTMLLKVTVTEEQPQRTLTGYEWSVDELTLQKGESANLTLYSLFSDGSKEDVTANAALQSSKTNVATVGSGGRVNAVAAGKANITFSIAAVASVGIANPRPVTVTVTEQEPQKQLTGYEWSVSSLTLEKGEEANVKLSALFSDGSRENVTSSAALYSNDNSVATINSNGKIKAVGAGNTNIMMGRASIASGGIKNPRPLNVTVKAELPPEPDENTDFEVEGVDNGVAIMKYNGNERYIDIPGTINGEDVVEIGSKAFYGNKNIVSVSMPNSVTAIGDAAFYNCTALKSVSLSNNISNIGKYAFDSCNALTGITLPGSLEEISAYTFRNCKKLSMVTIPRGVTRIESNAFASCKVMDITVLSTDVEIANNAFAKGSSLIFYGKVGSTTESYAKNNEFTFIPN